MSGKEGGRKMMKAIFNQKSAVRKEDRNKSMVFAVVLMAASLILIGCGNGDPMENGDADNDGNGQMIDNNGDNGNGEYNDDENGEGENDDADRDPDENDDTDTWWTVEEISTGMYAKLEVPYRKEPIHDGEVLGTVERLEFIEVSGITDNGWIRIESVDSEGYIHSRFLTEEEPELRTWGTGQMEEEMLIVSDPDDIEVIANKEIALPFDYEPADLVTLNVSFARVSNYRLMRQVAADALKEMFDEALEEGITLYARTGYRSFEAQEQIFTNFVANHGYDQARRFSAKPGQSEHQTGLAIDITSDSVDHNLSQDFGSTPEGEWVGENAHRFGYVIRYPRDKEEITGYMYEPWHIRYFGVELATELYESGLTYEEYLGLK